MDSTRQMAEIAPVSLRREFCQFERDRTAIDANEYLFHVDYLYIIKVGGICQRKSLDFCSLNQQKVYS
jgi:hypothetical protein